MSNQLIAKLETQLKEISGRELSWLGKIAVFKMSYHKFFITSALHQSSYLRTMVSLIWKFVLGGKKARCPEAILSHIKEWGVLD